MKCASLIGALQYPQHSDSTQAPQCERIVNTPSAQNPAYPFM